MTISVSTGNRPLGYSTLIGENNKSDKVDSRVKKSKEYVNLEDDSPSAVQSDDSDEVIVVKDSLMENDKSRKLLIGQSAIYCVNKKLKKKLV